MARGRAYMALLFLCAPCLFQVGGVTVRRAPVPDRLLRRASTLLWESGGLGPIYSSRPQLLMHLLVEEFKRMLLEPPARVLHALEVWGGAGGTGIELESRGLVSRLIDRETVHATHDTCRLGAEGQCRQWGRQGAEGQCRQ